MDQLRRATTKKFVRSTLATLIAVTAIGGGIAASAAPTMAATPLYLPFPAAETYQVAQIDPDGAVDLTLPSGTSVMSSAAGIVLEAGPSANPAEGIAVVVDIGNNACLQYLDLGGVAMSPGEVVYQSQRVGAAGGNATTLAGSTLHWNTVSCSTRQPLGSLTVAEYPEGVSAGQWVTSQNRREQ